MCHDFESNTGWLTREYVTDCSLADATYILLDFDRDITGAFLTRDKKHAST